MKKIAILFYTLLLTPYFLFSQNIGVGTVTPAGKLHVKGAANVSQLVIDANSTQGNINPLIRLRNDGGKDLMWIHTDDSTNIFIGQYAGRTNAATANVGIFNTFLGRSSGYSNSTGYWNTAIGANTLYSNTTGFDNTAQGYTALYSNTTGMHNSAFGANALYLNNTGLENTAVGSSALYSNTHGRANTAMGLNALSTNTVGEYNTATGAFSLFYNSTGNYNCANGANALHSNTTGNSNTATGFNVLYSNTFGEYNTAIGKEALFSNTGGIANTACGALSLYYNTTASRNTAHGVDALYHNTSGESNTASGMDALFDNTTGSYNVAMGGEALNSNTTGGSNVAIGESALYRSITSEDNTAVGRGAGGSHVIGSFNTFVGSGSNCNADGLTGCLALGVQSRSTASYQARIGNGNTTSIGGYANWTNISDGRIKRNIQDNVPGLAFITKLKPVTYNLDLKAADKIIEPSGRKDKNGKSIPVMQFETDARQQKEQIVYTGFIAQEVEKAAREINYDFSGVDAAKNDKDLYGLRYAEFVVPLVKAVQEQQQIISKQQIQINELLKRLEMLEKKGKE